MSHQGLESLHVSGAVLEISTTSQDVLLKQANTTSENQQIRYREGKIFHKALVKTIGVNKEKVEAYRENFQFSWQLEDVGSDSTEYMFEAFPIDSKPPPGSWPFVCNKVIPCADLPLQTCGCAKDLYEENSVEKGIVYNLGEGSKIPQTAKFSSCEELKQHGVSIRGFFNLDGVKTYCDTWSKYGFYINI